MEETRLAKELFGTDGIRGVAGSPPLDQATVYAFGVALGREAAAGRPAPEIVIGADTRESGAWLAGLVAGGLAAAGVGARFAGVTTTQRTVRRGRHDLRLAQPLPR